jgi:hypothetical protein
VPSGGMLASQGSGLAMPLPPGALAAAGLAAARGAPLGLPGMGKLIPSPVPAPILSPLPALSGPAPVRAHWLQLHA